MRALKLAAIGVVCIFAMGIIGMIFSPPSDDVKTNGRVYFTADEAEAAAKSGEGAAFGMNWKTGFWAGWNRSY